MYALVALRMSHKLSLLEKDSMYVVNTLIWLPFALPTRAAND